jgi:fructosamine-3-kinase
VSAPDRCPADVRAAVGRALERRGLGSRIARAQPVGGGCIHNGTRIETDTGATLFLKWSRAATRDMFEAEADGLRALAAARAIRAPEPVAWGGGKRGAWLLMEYVPTGRAAPDTAERLGRGLAALHGSGAKTTFGWRRDNWIGSLPQDNTATERWSAFWRDRRLAPQLEHARQLGYARQAAFDRVLDLTPEALAHVTRPELVHGDLWSGNWLAAEGGGPVLIDPAVYLGHGEVDLAMSELFGGFEPAFYDAYGDARRIPPEYRAYRRELYQLYYLLVHVNLFGAS